MTTIASRRPGLPTRPVPTTRLRRTREQIRIDGSLQAKRVPVPYTARRGSLKRTRCPRRRCSMRQQRTSQSEDRKLAIGRILPTDTRTRPQSYLRRTEVPLATYQVEWLSSSAKSQEE